MWYWFFYNGQNQMMSVTAILYAVILISIIVWVNFKVKNSWLAPMWLPWISAKLIAAFALTYLYVLHYQAGDMLAYFQDAEVYRALPIIESLKEIFSIEASPKLSDQLVLSYDPRAAFMTKIVALVNLPSGNIWLTSFAFSILSAIAVFYFVIKLGQYLPKYRLSLQLAFLWLPSLLFWTSGITKESIAFPALLLCTLPFIQLTFDNKQISIVAWIIAFVSLLVLWQLKYYVVAVALPILGSVFFIDQLVKKSLFVKTAWWVLATVLPIALVTQLHPNLYAHRICEVIFNNHQTILNNSPAYNTIPLSRLTPDCSSIIFSLPSALFSGLFMPLMGTSESPLTYLMAAENIVILVSSIVLIGLALFYYKKWKSPFFILPLLAYILILAGVLTIATPNYGTLIRFKVYYLPFFVLLIGCGMQYFTKTNQQN
jgi:hypothetical protein